MRTLLPLALVIFLSCHKSTIVNGLLVDKKTELPIDSATIEYDVYHSKDSYVPYITHTDQNGKFSFEDEGQIYIYTILANNYVPKGMGTHIADIRKGKVNDIVVSMAPIDGKLKVKFTNVNGLSDTLYFAVHSPVLESELEISLGYFVDHFIEVPANATREIYINAASEETVDIYWSFSPWLTHLEIKHGPGHGSVYIVPKDTSSFDISF